MAAERATLAGLPVLDELPCTTPEFKRRAQDFPTLTSLASQGVGIYGGLTELMLADRHPLGPAPHTPWAKPLRGGKLRVIAVSTVRTNGDIGEIERRLDCEVYHLKVLQQYHYPKQYPEAFKGYLADRARAVLKRDADVILVEPNIRLLPEDVSQALLRKVENGCGMVVIGGGRYGGGQQYGYWLIKDKIACCKEVSDSLAQNVDLRYKKFATIDEHEITSSRGLFDGIPWEFLPAHHLFRMEAASGADVLARDKGEVLAIGGRWGEGRVVLLPWACWQGAFPIAEDNRVPPITPYHDYYASAMARAILWAARREAPLRLAIDRRDVEAASRTKLTLSIDGNIPPKSKAQMRLRDTRGESLWSADRELTAASLPVELPSLAAAKYLLDIVTRDVDSNALGWASFALHVRAKGALTVTLDRDRYKIGEPARITAKIVGVPPGALTGRVRISDALHRLVFEEEKKLAGAAVEWVFPNADPLAVLHYVDVGIRRDDEPYLKSRVDLFVPRYQPDDFYCWLWPGSRPDYVVDRVYRRQREALGFGVIMGGGYGGTHKARNYRLLTTGCIPFLSNVAVIAPEKMEKAPVETRRKTLEMVEGSLDELRRFGGVAFFFQDERHGRGDSETPTEEALAEFHKYLKRQYRDIGALNKAWGRAFKSFDNVAPVLTKQFDAKKETSLAPWLDWRMWALHEVVETDRLSAKRIREAVEQPCNLGLEGIFGLAMHNIPYGGTDLSAQSDFFNVAGPYGENILNACRSFFPDFLFSWSGYNRKYSEYQRYIWSCAFQGHGGLGWWYGPIYHNAADCWYPQARWIRDLTKPLREGVGKLIRVNSPSATDPIAFLYSQSSLYAMSILGKTVDPAHSHLFVRPAAWARRSLQRMFQDAGVQFGYVSEKQLQSGKAGGVKMLVLSSCVALEPETCRALEKFVENGGTVLADLCPGVWDDHGAYCEPGQLDGLFGVKRDERFRFKTMVSDWGVGTFEAEPDFNIKGQWYIGQYYEETLKTSDGRALGKHIFHPETPPAFVFKRTGKGVTILMNYLETEYRRVPEHWQITLMKELLRFAGIPSPVTMRDHMQNGEILEKGRKIFRWSDGDAKYLGVLLDEGKYVQFELPQAGHVYELSRGVYLGQGSEPKLDLRDEPHALFAILPYRIDGLRLAAPPARLGAGLKLDIRLATKGTPARHVVHLDVMKPDGSRCHHLCRNVVLKRGRWLGNLPLALNEPTGKWQIEAREVVSGKTAKAEVVVQ